MNAVTKDTGKLIIKSYEMSIQEYCQLAQQDTAPSTIIAVQQVLRTNEWENFNLSKTVDIDHH